MPHRRRFRVRIQETLVPSEQRAGRRSFAPSSPRAPFREQSTEVIEKLAFRTIPNASAPTAPIPFAERFNVERLWSLVQACDLARTPSLPARLPPRYLRLNCRPLQGLKRSAAAVWGRFAFIYRYAELYVYGRPKSWLNGDHVGSTSTKLQLCF